MTAQGPPIMPGATASRWRRWLPAAWLGLSAVCLAVDYVLGPFIQFPIVYLIPTALASWFNGRRFGLALAVVLPLFRLYFITQWKPPWTLTEAAVNAAIRIAVIGSFAWLIDAVARRNKELASDVRLLSGMLPVCSRCLKVHDAQGTWEPLETHIVRNPGAFRHELCPDCGRLATDVFDRR